METIRDLALHSGSLQIDDKRFIDCSFTNCVLEYSGRPVLFERTHLRGCRYVFFGPAKCTLHFLQCTGLMPHEDAEWAETSESVN